jgi:putative ABC transport system substrate-binding protein
LLTAKRLELLRELAPNARAFSVLVNPKNANAQLQMDEAWQAARALGAAITFVNASTEKEIERAFDDFRQQHTDALLFLGDSLLNDRVEAFAGQRVLAAETEKTEIARFGHPGRQTADALTGVA